LLAVSVQLAREDEVRDFTLSGRRFPVILNAAFDAVDVSVEDAGVAVFAKKD
jgi:hypothetical protein